MVGLEVARTHIHLIPIDTTADLDFSLAQDTAPERLAATAGKIIKSLQDRGYSEADV